MIVAPEFISSVAFLSHVRKKIELLERKAIILSQISVRHLLIRNDENL